MLVLTRKPGEQLVIGQDIQVVVLSVRGKRVKLGITGPATAPVCRGELRRRVPPLADVSGPVGSAECRASSGRD